MEHYVVNYLIPYPYPQGYVNPKTGLDHYTLFRSKTFYNREKAIKWARKWCPFGFCLITFVRGKNDSLTGSVDNFCSLVI